MSKNGPTAISGKGMRGIRPLQSDDLQQVAALYEKVVRSGKPAPPPGLVEDFDRFFLKCPLADPEIPSLVFEDEDNRIAGFLGMYVRQLQLDGRSIRMACSGQLVTDETSRSRGVGIFLTREHLKGPQELSITDGSTHTVARLWEYLGGQTCQLRSIQWTKTFRPWAFAANRAKSRAPLRSLAVASRPFTWLLDQPSSLLRRASAKPEQKITTQDLGVREMVSSWKSLTAKRRLTMDYNEEYLDWLMKEMRSIRSRGALHAKSVVDKRGSILGWYIYFLAGGGTAQVVQLIAADGQADTVVDAMFEDADRRGAAAMAGRVEPDLLESLTRHRCHLRYGQPLSLIHSPDPEILSLLNSKFALLTRLDGELWTSFHRETYHQGVTADTAACRH
jgi:hypothetical protein